MNPRETGQDVEPERPVSDAPSVEAPPSPPPPHAAASQRPRPQDEPEAELTRSGSRVRVRRREDQRRSATPPDASPGGDPDFGRPSDDPLYWGSQNQCRTVYLHLLALESISEHAYGSLRAEVGGFLIGRSGVDERGAFTIVDHVQPALQAAGTSIELEFPPEAWVELHSLLDRAPGSHHVSCVGWYHTHPSLGLFLSGHDLFLHRHWFPDDAQIAIVADPAGGDAAIFVANGGAVISPARPESTVKLLAPARLGGVASEGRALIAALPRYPVLALSTISGGMPSARITESPQNNSERRIAATLPKFRVLALAILGFSVFALLYLLVVGFADREPVAQGGDNASILSAAPSGIPPPAQEGSLRTEQPVGTSTATEQALPTSIGPPAPCGAAGLSTRVNIVDMSSASPREGILVLSASPACVIDAAVAILMTRPNRQFSTVAQLQGLLTDEGLEVRLPSWKWCEGPSHIRVETDNVVLVETDVAVPDSCSPG